MVINDVQDTLAPFLLFRLHHQEPVNKLNGLICIPVSPVDVLVLFSIRDITYFQSFFGTLYKSRDAMKRVNLFLNRT